MPGFQVFSQGLITGSTVRGTEIEKIKNNTNVKLSKLIGNNTVNLNFIKIDGADNIIELDPKQLALALNLNTGGGSLEADLILFKIKIASNNTGKNKLYLIGHIGPFLDLEIILGFTPAMSSITTASVKNHIEQTPVEIAIKTTSGKVLYNKDVIPEIAAKSKNKYSIANEITGIYSNNEKNGFFIGKKNGKLFMSILGFPEKKYILKEDRKSYPGKYSYYAESMDFGIRDFSGTIYFGFGEKYGTKVLNVLYTYREYYTETLRKIGRTISEVKYNFNSTDLEKRWTLFGSPLPRISIKMGNPSPCFNNNGDESYGSGALSKRTFDYTNGLVIESDMYVTSNPNGCWISASMGFAKTLNCGNTKWPGFSVSRVC